MGSDPLPPQDVERLWISIHTPRMGSDLGSEFVPLWPRIFQSTLPVWGVTAARVLQLRQLLFQSTLPVWGVTATVGMLSTAQFDFQSTLPVWGVTIEVLHKRISPLLSIHTPCMGSDKTQKRRETKCVAFNPHSPYGE